MSHDVQMVHIVLHPASPPDEVLVLEDVLVLDDAPVLDEVLVLEDVLVLVLVLDEVLVLAEPPAPPLPHVCSSAQSEESW
jgi:hypothetical protein